MTFSRCYHCSCVAKRNNCNDNSAKPQPVNQQLCSVAEQLLINAEYKRSAGFIALHFQFCTTVYYLLIRSYLTLSPALHLYIVVVSFFFRNCSKTTFQSYLYRSVLDKYHYLQLNQAYLSVSQNQLKLLYIVSHILHKTLLLDLYI